MVAVAVACLVVTVVLGVALLRTRAQLARLGTEVERVTGERDARHREATTAADRAAAALAERDDAFERVQRARRDAAEVAARLNEETTARAEAEAAVGTAERAVAEEVARRDALEAELAASREEIERRTVELEEVRSTLITAPASTGADLDYADALWELALARVEGVWRTSISLNVDEGSPLDGARDPLRAAVEIEVEAAREEAGADIELHWSGAAAVPPAAAVVVLSLVEFVIGAVVKSARSTAVHVTVAGHEVEVRFEAVDDLGRPLPVTLPATLSGAPGEVRIPMADRS